jgi:hypothetical protein
MHQLINIVIHEDEVKNHSKKIQKFIEDNKTISFYKDKPNINKEKEFLKIIRNIRKQIKDSKNKESNIEAIMVDQITELISRMSLKEFRKILKHIKD